jgi:hypothetical protein
MAERDARTLDEIAAAARQASGLNVLLLFGSRARGDVHVRSDWDFGYLAAPAFDPDALGARLVEILDTDRIDLADLARASGLLRYRAAIDGITAFESSADAADAFRLDAVRFWCDAAPVLERGYAAVLDALPE